ncbi:MAG: ATP-binding cassette domain-containing protein, partial [Chloroflexi bacterium]|nr:ATP-binding cassette domain-containing protein [Chloroflexota bacterium]
MALLKVENLSRRYGAVVAVDGVNLSVEPGTIHSVIGPNGAGKTTLFRVITGEVRPSAGRVLFEDREISSLPSHKMPHLGIARSFQRTTIFPNLTVYENVWAASYARTVPGLFSLFRRGRDTSQVEERIEHTLAELDLNDKRTSKARELSHAEQRALEVAMALASAPSLLLMDEPAAGLSGDATRRIMTTIRQLGGRYTILLIE